MCSRVDFLQKNAKKQMMNELNTSKQERVPTIYLDLLGGDACEETELNDYEGDALPRNLEALEIFLKKDYGRLIAGKINLVLFGRESEIMAVVDKVRNGVLLPAEMLPTIDVVDCQKQTPMGSKKPARKSSMSVMFGQAKELAPNLIYTAGSTAAQVSGAAQFRDRELGKPFIAKRLIPGVEFGDNGAIVQPSPEDYVSMYNALRNHHDDSSKKSAVMLLPSDNMPPAVLKKLISEAGADRFIDFDPLSELGLNGRSQKPSEVLGDGFIGNLHLKFIELLYKAKVEIDELKDDAYRASIRERIKPLAGDNVNGWELPQNLPECVGYGLLCNGTEDTKGTPQLKAFFKQMEAQGRTVKFVEPADIFSNPNLIVLATPASKQLADAFFVEGLGRKINRHPLRAIGLKRASRKSTAMAEIVNLKAGSPRVMAAHGEAPVAETAKNLSEMVNMVLTEAKS
jgi:hypothetical protein